jgi:hypothetical protein
VSEAVACMRQLLCTAVSPDLQLIPLHHCAHLLYPACLIFLHSISLHPVLIILLSFVFHASCWQQQMSRFLVALLAVHLASTHKSTRTHAAT